MIETATLLGKGCLGDIELIITDIEENTPIDEGHVPSKTELNDYNRARVYLRVLAREHRQTVTDPQKLS